MSDRIEPISRRRGALPPSAVQPLRDDDDERDRERRRRQPPAEPDAPRRPAVTRDADGHPHVDVRA